MKLRRFKTDSFAGVAGKEVVFKNGLNVLLGPNEAGKSTIIEAIYHTIFKDSKLRMNRSDDRDFYERFRPYPEGDYINGYLSFEVNGQRYSIEKEWGEEPSAYLELPDGQKFTGSKKIAQVLEELFSYGEGTYGNIVFTRQRDVKSAIEKIASNDRVTGTVSSFLRRAVMELDGISVDQLRIRINEELAGLLKRWDYHNMRPENTDRDVHNPYKQGYGRVYGAYIDKEQTRIDMERALKVEREYETISGELKELKDKEEVISLKISKLAGVEGDILQRGQIEPRIAGLNDKIEELKGINTKWPVLKSKLEEKEKDLNEKENRLKALKQEKEQARRLREKEQLDERLARIEKKKEAVIHLQEEKGKLPAVTGEDIKNLGRLKEKKDTSKASIEAATLIGRIKSTDRPLLITRGLNEEEELGAGEEFTAEGYLRIKTGELDIEIQSGQIDFTSLQQDYHDSRKEFKALLEKLKAADLLEVRDTFRRLQDIDREIKALTDQIEEIMAGDDYEELKDRSAELTQSAEIRPLPAVEEELEEVKEIIQNLKIEKSTIKNTVVDWEEKYDDHDNLFDKIVDLKAEINEAKKELAGLAELPESFDTVQEFSSQLSLFRGKEKDLRAEYDRKREELDSIKESLPELSYEELAASYEETAREYDRLVKRAGSMLKIQEVFEEKLQEMDSDSFQPLIDSFSKYLTKLTAGNYEIGIIDEDFQIEVRNGSNKALPADINLLSFGTYDGVALALRFALMEQLFKDREGFLVLDDCLVNLDPVRRKEAIDLINTFARDNQVIFTTCNPETARQLGGNLIEM